MLSQLEMSCGMTALPMRPVRTPVGQPRRRPSRINRVVRAALVVGGKAEHAGRPVPGGPDELPQAGSAGVGVPGVRVPAGLAGDHPEGTVDMLRVEVFDDERPPPLHRGVGGTVEEATGLRCPWQRAKLADEDRS